jgi:hypothetical protein
MLLQTCGAGRAETIWRRWRRLRAGAGAVVTGAFAATKGGRCGISRAAGGLRERGRRAGTRELAGEGERKREREEKRQTRRCGGGVQKKAPIPRRVFGERTKRDQADWGRGPHSGKRFAASSARAGARPSSIARRGPNNHGRATKFAMLPSLPSLLRLPSLPPRRHFTAIPAASRPAAPAQSTQQPAAAHSSPQQSTAAQPPAKQKQAPHLQGIYTVNAQRPTPNNVTCIRSTTVKYPASHSSAQTMYFCLRPLLIALHCICACTAHRTWKAR